MKFKVTAAQRVPAGALDRAGKTDLVIFYTDTDDGHAGYVTIADEGVDNDKITAAVLANEKELAALAGRSLEA